jgi:hypothetical protein
MVYILIQESSRTPLAVSLKVRQFHEPDKKEPEVKDLEI